MYLIVNYRIHWLQSRQGESSLSLQEHISVSPPRALNTRHSAQGMSEV